MSELLELQVLFTAIRSACSPRSWSRGIELARAEGVDGQQQNEDGIELRVKVPGRTIAPTVFLYPDDEDWECDCDSTADACEHIAAAIIALRKARKEGADLPRSASGGGTLRYRLSRDGDRMRLERLVLRADGELLPLTVSLGGLLSGREQGPAVEPKQVDLSIDHFLQLRRLRSLPGDVVATLLPLLADVAELYLEDERVLASDKAICPRATVDEHDGGFVLRIEAADEIEEVLVSGIARCRGEPAVLRPLGETALSGLKLEQLPSERSFDRSQVAELIGEVLPALRSRIEVEVRTKRLPRMKRDLKPHVVLELAQQGARLSVLPIMVYGDPPTARLDGERLVHLGGPLPMRDTRAEAREAARLREQLDMVVGRRTDALGQDAIALARSLRSYRGAINGDVHRRLYSEQALTPRVAIDGVRLGVGFELEGQGGERLSAEASEVLRAWQAGESVVPLIDGGWAALPADWLARYGDQIGDLLLARGEDGALPPLAQPALARLCDDLDQARPPELDRLAPLIDGFEAIPSVDAPDGYAVAGQN